MALHAGVGMDRRRETLSTTKADSQKKVRSENEKQSMKNRDPGAWDAGAACNRSARTPT